MGSLAFGYAVKGLGEGMVRQQDYKAKEKAAEAQGAREIQLQRQRDKAANERLQTEIKARESARKDEYAQKATELRTRIDAEASADAKQQAHEIQIEEMRQKAKLTSEQMRLDIKEPVFELETIPGREASVNMMTGEPIPAVRRQEVLKDKMTGLSYTQKNVDGNSVWVPSTQAMEPTAERIRAGSALIGWLTTANTRQEQMDRLFQFQKLFHHVPPQYFAAYGRGFQQRMQQRDATTVTAPSTVAE